MLLRLWPYALMPLEMSVRQRLECLETRLRRSSRGQITIADYAEWLQDDRIPAVSRVTLHQDFRRYARLFDDVEYGEGKKHLVINSAAGEDARRWLMGYAWGEHPLRPRLSSSVARCLLLAQITRQEVCFTYRSVAGTSFRLWRGSPYGLIAGSDSAYIRMWMEDGRIIHFDLARIHGVVEWTGASTSSYPCPETDPPCKLTVTFTHPELLARLVNQFQGFNRADAKTAVIMLPRSLVVMTADVVEAWLRRHSPPKPSGQRRAPRKLEFEDGSRLEMEEVAP